MTTTFSDLGLHENIVSAITELGFETPTEIQQKAIPVFIERTSDLVALAQTGTGTGAVAKSINLINDTKNSLVDEFSKIGKTSLAAIEAQSTALEGAIDKGFSGQSVRVAFRQH